MSQTRARAIPAPRRPFPRLLAAALAVGLAACAPGGDAPDGGPNAGPGAEEPAAAEPAPAPDGDTVPAVLAGLERDEPSVRVPDTVPAGEAFTVVVESTGRNGCWHPGVARVEVEGLQATVRPRDVTPPADAMCTQALVTLTHEVVVRFDEAGEARVVVEGRNAEGDAVRVSRTVTVRGG